jgi:pimeloyl-ACP methyl ester carboxylesterase
MAVRFRVAESLELAGDVEGQWNGNPVLLLHGGGQTRHSWGYTASALGEAGFLAINLDLRGHGYSDWVPDGNCSIDAYAAESVRGCCDASNTTWSYHQSRSKKARAGSSCCFSCEGSNLPSTI